MAGIPTPPPTTPPTGPPTTPQLRYLWVYPILSPVRTAKEEGFAQRLREQGHQVQGLGIPCPKGWLTFPDLDQLWQQRDPILMASYEQLAQALAQADVLIAAGGSMLHPAFVDQLSQFKVFICADDPEHSHHLSQPVATHFDLCLPTNIACLDDYRSWGCDKVHWLFHAYRPQDTDPTLTADRIRQEERSIPVSMFCERTYGLSDRHDRIEALAKRFSQAVLRGKGWPDGYASEEERWQILRQSTMGWNLHNTTGPTNTRTFSLPAMGILQIADNKSNLGRIFQLDREVIGFDSMQECMDKTAYYMAHPEEAREIAARGWQRVTTEYTEEKLWLRISSLVQQSMQQSMQQGQPTAAIQINSKAKPRLLLLADRRGWAYDQEAQAMAKALADEFTCKIAYVHEAPDLSQWPFDLCYVFFWGETYQQAFISNKQQVIKQISSHRWAEEESYGRLTAEQFVATHLQDAGTVTCISKRLQALISPYRSAHLVPQGMDAKKYYPGKARTGPLRIGWAGNAQDPCKGLQDILLPAVGKEFELHIAGGDFSPAAMLRFYQTMDVICVASTAEGGPLPLIEAMACGCFPIAVDVGIVPELIESGRNGLVAQRSVAAFQQAFTWCAANLGQVRSIGSANARDMHRQRNWPKVMQHRRQALHSALAASAGSTARPADKPKICILVDFEDWAQGLKTNNLMQCLGDRYQITKRLQHEATAQDIEDADLVMLFYWRQLQSMQDLHETLENNRHKLCMGISSHNELEGEHHDAGLALLRRMARLTFMNSRLLYDEYAPQLLTPSFYLPNGVDTEFFHPLAGKVPGQTLRIGWAGSLENHGAEMRGYPNFIQPALAQIAGVELVTAAREDQWRGPEEMRSFYQSLDLYICASRVEGTPNPCLEAAACGVPLITTAVGNMPELVRDGENGLFIQRDVQDIVRAVTSLRDKPKLLAVMGQQIRQDALTWHWPLQASSYGMMWDIALQNQDRNQELTAEQFTQKGEELYGAGNLQNAARHFHWALLQDPSHAPALNNLGVWWSQHNEPVTALSFFKRALQLGTDRETILHNCSHLVANNQEMSEADAVLLLR